MLTLENEVLHVEINPKGAELTHVIDRQTGFDFIWNGVEWPKHAPILFPSIGRSTNDEYLLEGKSHPMQQHGFAADYEFEVLESSIDFIRLLFEDNAETRLSYPFHFEFIVTYRLVSNQLEVTFEVENQAKRDLSFALGFHPAFALPERFEDYRVEFDTADKELEQFEIIKNPFPYRTGKKVSFDRMVSGFELERALFAEGLIILNNKIHQVKLLSEQTNFSVSVEMADFPYLCLWTKEDLPLPYLCIEPFQGLPDIVGEKQELLEKEGNIILSEGEGATYKVKLTFEN